jgi:DNA-binding MarR family transcriptional regulator
MHSERPKPANTLPQALVRLMLAVEDTYGLASREVGLTAQQAQLLCLARRPAPIGGLADAMRCDRSNVSRMVDRAGSRGLVARGRDERDRRITVVMLTEAGERTMRRFIEALDGRIEQLVGQWSPDRRDTARELLNDLAGALEAADPGDEPLARPSAVRALRGL